MTTKKYNILSIGALSLVAVVMIGGTVWVSASDVTKRAEAATTEAATAAVEIELQTEASTEAATVSETEARTLETAVDAASATKDDIFHLMLNSIDYYDSISGTMLYPTEGTILNVVEFQCKLSTADAYQHYTQYETGDSTLAQSAAELDSVADASSVLYDTETYCSEELLVTANNVDSTYIEEMYQATTLDQVCDVDDSERVSIAGDGQPCYTYRTNPTNAPEASMCIFPQEMAFGFLTDQSLWEIAGVEIVEGRECYHITGTTSQDYGNKQGVTTFEFEADCQTGVLVQYVGYDANGNISDYLYTEGLRFEDDSEAVTAFSDACVAGYTEQSLW